MTIEWKKVTWYSNLLAIILAFGIFGLGFYLGNEYRSLNPEQDVFYKKINKEVEPQENLQTKVIDTISEVVLPQQGRVTLGVGQRAKIGDLEIVFNKFIQDSRCPVDVVCIQAGAVTVNVTFTQGPHSETRNMPSDEIPYKFEDYQISIVDVSPPRKSTQEIDFKDYKITFKVIPKER